MSSENENTKDFERIQVEFEEALGLTLPDEKQFIEAKWSVRQAGIVGLLQMACSSTSSII